MEEAALIPCHKKKCDQWRDGGCSYTNKKTEGRQKRSIGKFSLSKKQTDYYKLCFICSQSGSIPPTNLLIR